MIKYYILNYFRLNAYVAVTIYVSIILYLFILNAKNIKQSNWMPFIVEVYILLMLLILLQHATIYYIENYFTQPKIQLIYADLS